jgi:hypothetical protein
MKRKIIQIVDRFIGAQDEAVLVALADDGTLWEGCNRCINEKQVMDRQSENNRRPPGSPAQPTIHRVYEFRWEQLAGLPDDNSNITKRWPQ